MSDARLAAVFGRTKAAVLLALDEPLGTAALAARLGLAASTVSEHLTALRDVGILTECHAGHEVRATAAILATPFWRAYAWS